MGKLCMGHSYLVIIIVKLTILTNFSTDMQSKVVFAKLFPHVIFTVCGIPTLCIYAMDVFSK